MSDNVVRMLLGVLIQHKTLANEHGQFLAEVSRTLTAILLETRFIAMISCTYVAIHSWLSNLYCHSCVVVPVCLNIICFVYVVVCNVLYD